MGCRKTATLIDSLGRERKPTRAKWGKVRRLPSGRLQASYVGPDGVRYTAPTTYTTQTDADGWLSAQRADIERGRVQRGWWVMRRPDGATARVA